MLPILFVHGFSVDKNQYQPVIKYLRKRGINNNFYEFEYSNNVGFQPIKAAAKELAEYIEKNVNENEINIVSYSQGGIIALAYLKFYKNKKVNKIFTVCTPHQGTKMANGMILPGLIDLRPQSDLLKALEIFEKENRPNIYSLYTPFDVIVFPGWNAKSKYAKNKIIFAPTHLSAFYWPATKRFIYKNLI